MLETTAAPIVMMKGTNCTGKSVYPLWLRKHGWKEQVVERRNKDNKVIIRYTVFSKGKHKVYVLGKYGDKGGGCDGMNKEQILRTIEFLYVKKPIYPIFMEGLGFGSVMTTHPAWMLRMGGYRALPGEDGPQLSFKCRGAFIGPRSTFKEASKKGIRRLLHVICLDVPLELIWKRLQKRNPGYDCKGKGKYVRHKHEALQRQYPQMKGWKETRDGLMQVHLYKNYGKNKKINLVETIMGLLWPA